jgi:hypothetical protein
MDYTKQELETIKTQVLAVRATAGTNMFDTNAVQRIANDMELYDLVCFLAEKENRKAYSCLILHGEFPE